MRFILLVLVLLTSWLGAVPAHAAVELSYFEIEQVPGPPQLLVKWGTETERDTVLFILKRGDNANPAQANEIHRTPARGTAVTGWDYEFPDTDVTDGRVYYYWLIEQTGSGEEKPVGSTQATAGGGTATPTPTAPTATVTPTVQPATATPTVQPATATPIAQPPTATPTAATQGTTNAPQPAATPTPQAPASTPTTGALVNTPTNQPPAAATNPPAAPTTGTSPTSGVAASQPTAPSSGDTQPIQTTDAPATDASTPQFGERSQNQDAAVQETATSAPAPDQSNTTTTDQAGGDPTGEATATPQMLAEAPAAPQAQLMRPTATPRPSDSSDGGDNTSSLLMVIGAGSLCGATLLVLVVVFVWRRR
jgi:hypothetical protein